MKKKRNSSEVKRMIFLLVAILVIVMIGLVIFLFNVDVDNSSLRSGQNAETSNEDNFVEVNENEIITSELNYQSSYDFISNSLDGEYQVALSDDKLFFNILDEDAFNEKYPNNNLETENEIKIGEYGIKQINIGKIGDKEYLVIIVDGGKVGIMDIGEAVNNNNLAIRDELVSFNVGAIRIENVIRRDDVESENTIVIVTEDGQGYDLLEFI